MSTFAKYPPTPTGGGGGGTVTSVALTVPSAFLSVSGSPITTSGTFAITLNNEPANTVFAGPTSGSPAQPTFRALVSADIPALPYAQDSFTIIQTDTGTFPTATTATDVLTFHNTDGFISIAGNSGTNTVTLNLTSTPGTVTAVTASAPLSSSGGSTPNISISLANSTTNGYLSSTDWNTFNNKQPAGNYITALTGDGTATGPGSVAFTLATVNGNVGTFGTTTQVSTVTVNAKGLVTAASNTSIQIAESQVTNLVSDLAGKQPTGNYITALTGDVTATGPGSVAATLATVNGNVGSFTNANITVNAKGLITAASNGTNGTVTSVAMTVPSFLSVSGSPITTSGTLAVTLATESANTVFAGPTSGGAATPTFRSLVAADLPSSTVVTKTANYTLVAGDRGTRFLANTNGGAFNITLLSAATAGSGYSFYLIDKLGTFQTNNLSLVPNGTDKISGLNVTKVFQTNWGGWYIFTDGTDWYVV